MYLFIYLFFSRRRLSCDLRAPSAMPEPSRPQHFHISRFKKSQRWRVASALYNGCSRSNDGADFVQLRSWSSPQRACWWRAVHHSRPQLLSRICEAFSVGQRCDHQLSEMWARFSFCCLQRTSECRSHSASLQCNTVSWYIIIVVACLVSCSP